MSNKKAFTLVELLVIISLIGLLSTLAVFALSSARQKSRDAKRISDVKQFQTALELYYSDFSNYPGGNSLVLGSDKAKCLDGTGFTTSELCSNPYMEPVPENPIPGGADYVFSQTGEGAGYSVTFNLEGAIGGVGAGPHAATQDGIQ